MRKVDLLTVVYAQEGKNPIRWSKILVHLAVGGRVGSLQNLNEKHMGVILYQEAAGTNESIE